MFIKLYQLYHFLHDPRLRNSVEPNSSFYLFPCHFRCWSVSVPRCWRTRTIEEYESRTSDNSFTIHPFRNQKSEYFGYSVLRISLSSFCSDGFELAFQFKTFKLVKALCGSNGERFYKVTLVVVTIFISCWFITRMDVAGFACNLLLILEKIELTPVEFTFQFKLWLQIIMLEMIAYV